MFNRYLFFCAAVHYMVGLSDDEVIYNPLPLYHTAGGMVGMGQVSVQGINHISNMIVSVQL